jgi:hypothetical protein
LKELQDRKIQKKSWRTGMLISRRTWRTKRFLNLRSRKMGGLG